jgi:protein-S-isoprenylcysteine O-methyltransferase Ste14
VNQQKREHWRRVNDELARWLSVVVLAICFTGVIGMLQVPELTGSLRIATYCFAAGLPVAGLASSVILMAPEAKGGILRLRIATQLGGGALALAGTWATLAHLEYGAAVVFGVGTVAATATVSLVSDRVDGPSP